MKLFYLKSINAVAIFYVFDNFDICSARPNPFLSIHGQLLKQKIKFPNKNLTLQIAHFKLNFKKIDFSLNYLHIML
jgi:hypothetical protein